MRTLRLVHHQACTGGSLISRCLSAIPRVVYLSEISPGGIAPKMRYDPLAPMGQFLGAYPEMRPAIADLAPILGRQLQEVHDIAAARHARLVVRDHSHSDWMTRYGKRIVSIRLVQPQFEQHHAIVTVRHPFASYTSLVRNKWDAAVFGYGDYCRRYLDFLETLGDLPLFRYEDFCLDPSGVLTRMAEALDLGAIGQALNGWQKRGTTGNSGRAAELASIRPLALSGWSPALEAALLGLPDHVALCQRLGYPSSLAAQAEAQNTAVLLFDPVDQDAPQMLAEIARWRKAGHAAADQTAVLPEADPPATQAAS